MNYSLDTSLLQNNKEDNNFKSAELNKTTLIPISDGDSILNKVIFIYFYFK